MRIVIAAAIAMGALACVSALAGISSVSASGEIGTIFIFSDVQTSPSGAVSGSVFIQAQSLAATPEPIFQTSALVVDIVASAQTTGITTAGVPASVTIPSGAFSASFTYTAANSSPTVPGSFLLSVGGNLATYYGSSQTEYVEPDIAPAGTAVTAGNNNAGSSGPVPLAPGGTATYFTAAGAGIDNTSGATLYYDVIAVNGTFSAGGDGVVTGIGGECIADATGTTVVPPVVSVGSSPDRPVGTYPLEFLVESFSNNTCTTPVGFYQSESNLDITNAAYTALTPDRICDTRATSVTGAAADQCTGLKLTAGGVLTISVDTAASLPANTSAVDFNVTATDTSAAGYLKLYPAGGSVPAVANVNWSSAGATVGNSVVVEVGTSGDVTIYNALGNTDVVIDLQGYYTPETVGGSAGSYVPMTPDRICDTRATSVTGAAADECTGETMSAGGTLDVAVEGQGTVPASGVAAVVANVTVTNTSAASYLTAYPGPTRPLAANLNWSGAGDTVGNRIVIPLGSGGIILYNALGTTNVVVDVSGYYTTGSAAGDSLFAPVTSYRACDTRATSVTGQPADSCTGGTLGAGGILSLTLAGTAGLYPFGGNATAVITNVTATDTSAGSFLTVYPGPTLPLAADVNWTGAGATVGNLTFATLNSSGAVSVYNGLGSVDVIVDAFGFFCPTAYSGG
jgi:hypothetical protein